MTQYQVPLVSNSPDDPTRCMQACMAMVLGYFMPKRQFSMNELDMHSGKKPGKATWPMAALLWMRELGFEVVNIEACNYARLITERDWYLVAMYGEEVATWAIRNSDMEQVYADASAFISGSIKSMVRLPTVGDIKEYLTQGYLCICWVNSKALHKRPGLSGHFIVATGCTDEGLFYNDPGLPAAAHCFVANGDMEYAWSTPSEQTKTVMAFRLSA